MTVTENYYTLMGIPYDASMEEIRAAYRELVRQFHPDTSQNPATSDQFIQIQKAFEVLSDADRRLAYDASLPSELTSPPITLQTYYSRRTIPQSEESQLVYTLVRLSLPPSYSTIKVPPLNVCLVIDNSTSMQGRVMDRVKATAIEIIRGLKSEDIFSVVAFHDRAEVISPALPSMNRQRTEAAIRMLHPGGGTEIFKGLEAAMVEVQRYMSLKHINHIILLTDGRTYGDEAACLELASKAANLRIGISGLGIGSRWNDAFIDRLAAISGGSSMYISHAEEVKKFLQDKFSGLEQIFAEHLDYQFILPNGVELNYAFRLHPESSILETSSPLNMGFIHLNTPLDVLFEFRVKSVPKDVNNVVLAKGRVKGSIPVRAESTFSVRLEFNLPASSTADTSPAPQIIVQAMSQLTLYRIQERARQDIAAGEIVEGARRLQHLATHLLSQGQMELARMVLHEVEHVQQQHALSDEGEKRIKYGTRSLLLPPSIPENNL